MRKLRKWLAMQWLDRDPKVIYRYHRPLTGEICERCRFYSCDGPHSSDILASDESSEQPQGFCIRHAPKPQIMSPDSIEEMDEENHTVIWPWVKGYNECGEWRANPLLIEIGWALSTKLKKFRRWRTRRKVKRETDSV